MAIEWKKHKNVLIDFEDIDITKRYAITFNPCDKYQYFKDGQRLVKCMNEICSSLFYSLNVYTIELYPELSKNGRFHVHGYIQINDPIQWCLHHVHHLTNRGTLVLKPITEEEEWKKYITKQVALHRHIQNQTFRLIPIKNNQYKTE